jgi:hypothetical protein
MKTLYVIHHTHTDIGYTELQGRVARWQSGFVRQALDIIEHTRERVGPDFDGFAWTCETFWGVERFLEHATTEEAETFAAAVRSGAIGLSGSYLNLNELLGRDMLSSVLARAAGYGRSIGSPVDSAMTADINGYSWGYSQALHDNGIGNLFTCIHTHHGMYPLGGTQIPFWWETPKGDRVLVWSGEHYHFGNELGIVPGAVSSYRTKDDCDADMIYHDHWGVAERRIPRYLEELDARGYPYDFVPVMASGMRSDNAPPSPRIVDFIERWNHEHGDVCRIRMATLSQFFGRLRKSTAGIPVHRGDWPDWWSDGCAGDPESTMLFRRAQRTYEYYLRLLERYPDLRRADTRAVEDELALYSEHTFGHSFSMIEPWHFLVHAIAERKRGFAASAHDNARELLGSALEKLGAAPMTAAAGLSYRAINPLGHAVSGIGRLLVGHFEFHELGFDRGATLKDVEADTEVPCQLLLTPPGAQFLFHVELSPGEERLLELAPADRPGTVDGALRRSEGDGGEPETGDEQSEAVELVTPFVRIAWAPGDGIVSWVDTTTSRELLRPDRRHAAFTPVHEVTPMHGRDDAWPVRGKMELNRKGENAVRSSGCLVGSGRMETGDVFVSTSLDYGVPGANLYTVELRAYMDEPRVDVAVRMHKDSVWEPENVYLSLPFTTGTPDAQLWLDKAGAAVRPRIDQIPGTLTDFYSIQEGFAIVSEGYGVAVASPDGHLIQLGPLEHGVRLLSGDAALADDPAHAYAWLMTNSWETNFAAELGGFYEFRYSVMWGGGLADVSSALSACKDASWDILCLRLKRETERR